MIATLADAVLTQLRNTPGFATFDVRPDDSPPGPYVICDFEPGMLSPERLAGGSQARTWTFRTVVVARSGPTLRAVVELVRDALTDWRPDLNPAASPLREIDAGPELADDGPETNRRYFCTLTFRMHTTR